jgi:DNA repair protein RecO (recombination protein O)
VPKTKATLIRKFRLTESSLIVHWCTDQEGLIKTVAKGALRPKSPFAGQLDLFYAVELEYRESRKSDLHQLVEVSVTDHRSAIAGDYTSLLAATYFVQLIELTAEKETPIPELADLLERALDYLTTTGPTQRVILRYEQRLTEHLSIAPPVGMRAVKAIRECYHRVPQGRSTLMDMLPDR